MGSVFLNHIGIAVKTTENLRKLFEILELKIQHSEDVPEQSVETHFIPLPLKTTNLELLKPFGTGGAVERFLEKRGPGVHHLSFECVRGRLSTLSAELRSAGYELLYGEPKAGAHHMLVNFIHPKTADGLLIEIMEPMENSDLSVVPSSKMEAVK